MSAPTPAPSVSRPPPHELAPKPSSAATATLYASRAPNPLPRLTHRQSIPTPTPIPCRAPFECESEALAFTEKSVTPNPNLALPSSASDLILPASLLTPAYSALPSASRPHIQRQILFFQMQKFLKHGNHQRVIISLRQSRNRDRPNATRPHKQNRETPAMRREILQLKTRSRMQGRMRSFIFQPDGVRTPLVTHHHIPLPPNPVPIVRRYPRHRETEKWHTVKLDIDGHGNFPFFRGCLQRSPDRPSRLRIKMLELQPLFLQRNFFQILIDGHCESPGISFKKIPYHNKVFFPFHNRASRTHTVPPLLSATAKLSLLR